MPRDEPDESNVASADGIDTAQRSTIARRGLVVGLATGAYGISFGVLAASAGFGVAKTCALSVLMFTGASQFALVGAIGAGANPMAAAGNALLLGARNIAYGFSAAPFLPRRPVHRAASAQLVVDETIAIARAETTPAAQRLAFFATGLSVFVLWNLGTVIGAAAGGSLEPQRYGLDAMFPAAFLALLVPQLRQPGAPRAAVAGVALAAVAVPFTPVGVPVLAAALGALAAFTVSDNTSPARTTDAPGEIE